MGDAADRREMVILCVPRHHRGQDQHDRAHDAARHGVPCTRRAKRSRAFHGADARRVSAGGAMSHGRGLHFDTSDSFLNCELSTNSCVRYSGSLTTVVTMSHVPSSGSVKLSKKSLTTVRSL